MYILSRTIFKLLQIIEQISLLTEDGGVTLFNTLIRGEPINSRLRYLVTRN